jgi:hypothetical protein
MGKGLDNYVVNADGCWIWPGALDAKGYPVVTLRGSARRAHREMYIREKGAIPDGLTLDHFRLNPGPWQAPCSKACINPEHQEPVTARANVLRGDTPAARNAAKTRCPAGHPYNRRNTYRDTLNRRYCRACHTDRERQRRKESQ